MKLDEYVQGKPDPTTGAANKSTFCNRLATEMKKLSRFGVRDPIEYGVYYSKDKKKYIYEGDYPSGEAVFSKVKSELKTLIEAGERYHIEHNFNN